MVDAQSTPATRALRLNLFAFPADTDFRFVLLIIAVLGASVFLYDELVHHMSTSGLMEWAHWHTYCEAQAQTIAPIDDTFDAQGRNAHAFNVCMAPLQRTRAVRLAGGVAALMALAGIIFLLMPRWIVWRRRLVPLKEDDAPGVYECLEELCREAGMVRRPTFLWNVLNAQSEATQAFGHIGKPLVGLSGGLVARFYDDPAAFRAVVRHELAHLANRDVNKTYFALAVWYAFVVAVLVPFSAQVISWIVQMTLDLSRIGQIGACLFLSLLVLFTRNALLHTREAYADARAAFWDGPNGALRRVVAEERDAARPRWRLLSAHPSMQERLHNLENGDRLMPVTFAAAFGTGVVATVSFATLNEWSGNLLGYGIPFLEYGLAALICIVPAAAAISAGVWRSTFAYEVSGRSPTRFGRIALGLALGIALGDLFALQNTNLLAFADTSNMMAGLLVAIEWLGTITSFPLLVLLLYLFLGWVAAGSSAWLEAERGSASPQHAVLAGSLISGGVLTVWYTLLIQGLPFVVTAPLLAAMDPLAALVLLLFFIVTQPVIVLTLTVLWAYPLAARLRGVPVTTARWAFVGDTTRTLPPLAPLDPGRAAWAGLRAGLVFCSILLAVRVAQRLSVPEMAVTDSYKLFSFYAYLFASIGLQAFVAYWAATQITRLSTIHGLFAAFVTGSITSVGCLLINLVIGGGINLGFVWAVFSQTVAGGALVAVPLALWGAKRGARQRTRARGQPTLRPSSVG